MRIGLDRTRPGLDTCQLRTPAWALIKARVCSVLEPWDPTVGGLDPIRGGPVRTRGVLDQLRGLNCISRGPTLSHGGPDSMLMPWSISLSLDVWRPRSRPRGGVRCCSWPRVVARGWSESWPGPTYSSFTTRLKIVARVLHLHIVVRGTLFSGYRHEATPCEGRGHRIENVGVDPFRPAGVDVLYVNRGSLESENNHL
jgi:hypothetical protein